MVKTTKQMLLDIFENIDLTSSQSQGNFDKYLGNVEKGFKKFDEKVDHFDKALAKLEKKF
jgi:t-SNARE complex subunit (syntaxin)